MWRIIVRDECTKTTSTADPKLPVAWKEKSTTCHFDHIFHSKTQDKRQLQASTPHLTSLFIPKPIKYMMKFLLHGVFKLCRHTEVSCTFCR